MYKTDIPCKCGEYNLIITTGFVGYMGDAPCVEDYGECPKCGKKLNQFEINKRYINCNKCEDISVSGDYCVLATSLHHKPMWCPKKKAILKP